MSSSASDQPVCSRNSSARNLRGQLLEKRQSFFGLIPKQMNAQEHLRLANQSGIAELMLEGRHRNSGNWV
jgi:hypothetical protein